MREKIVVFLSDFGLKDPYVGVVKGVMLGINPGLRIIDLTHDISPQDVKEGAFVLGSVYKEFPPETVFLAVVDPGVGSERAGLVARSGNCLFVAPDNGILSFVFPHSHRASCNRITEVRYFRHPVSATFHARDIFGPVAAHLTLGVRPEQFGPSCAHPVILRWPKAEKTGEAVYGEILHEDRFGNLVTNISFRDHEVFLGSGSLEVLIAGAVCPVRRIYVDVPDGGLVALRGSSGFLEISVNGGSAAKLLGCGVGEPVVVRRPGK